MEKSTFIRDFEKMPKEIQDKILAYVNSILKKEDKPTGEKMKFDWQGGLKGCEETSVELQHKANEWR